MRTLPRKIAGIGVAVIAGAAIAAGSAGVEKVTTLWDDTTDGVVDVVGDGVQTGAELGNVGIEAGRSLGDSPASTTSTTSAESTPGLVTG